MNWIKILGIGITLLTIFASIVASWTTTNNKMNDFDREQEKMVEEQKESRQVVKEAIIEGNRRAMAQQAIDGEQNTKLAVIQERLGTLSEESKKTNGFLQVLVDRGKNG